MAPRNRNITSNIEHGKLPPQAIDLEEAVLGAILLEKDALLDIIDVLIPESFYRESNQKIYQAILDLNNESAPIDILTVCQKLRKKGEIAVVGGDYYVTQLTNRTASASNIQHHAMIVSEMHTKRKLIALGSELIYKSFDETSDVFELTEGLLTSAYNIDNTGNESSDVTNIDLVRKVTKNIENAKKLSGITGISTGLAKVDKLFRGYQKPDLIIKAGRPGSGKTTQALSEAIYMSIHDKKKVMFFSLEMSAEQLMYKIISSESNIPLDKIFEGELSNVDWQVFHSISQRIIDSGLIIVDNIFTLNGIIKKAKKQKIKGGLDIVYIDYLQLVGNSAIKNNREQEISSISRGIKMLAKEINIPVVALCQLSRAVESRGGAKVPMLSDLRESGCLSIETSYLYTKKGVQYNPTSRIKLLSLNKTKIKEMNSKNIPREPREVFRLKLASGRFVDCTDNHPILTSSGYVELKDLSLDDSIACAINFGGGKKNIPSARFIGWMIGNGCMYGYNVPSFITNDEVISEDFKEYILTTFGYIPKDHPHYQSKVYQYDCTNSPSGNRTKEGNVVTKWLKDNSLWGKKAKDKVIPIWVMEDANDDSVCSLLQGLWETDGSIAMGKTSEVISYSTTSNLLAHQIVFLLARIGIFSHLDNGFMSSKATTPCYKITISNYDFQKIFISKINLRGLKGVKLNNIRERLNSSKYTNKISRSTSIEIAELCKELKLKTRIQVQGTRRLTKNFLAVLIKELHDKKSTILDEYEWLLSPSIVFDSIDSIKSIGIKDIFDRHVPSTNNFIANGIIVHNSLEQDADIVQFIYRPEYYGILEDEDGASTKNKAYLIVAKFRNGSPKDIPLRFDGYISKFSDWEPEKEFIYQTPYQASAGIERNNDFDQEPPF